MVAYDGKHNFNTKIGDHTEISIQTNEKSNIKKSDELLQPSTTGDPDLGG